MSTASDGEGFAVGGQHHHPWSLYVAEGISRGTLSVPYSPNQLVKAGHVDTPKSTMITAVYPTGTLQVLIDAFATALTAHGLHFHLKHYGRRAITGQVCHRRNSRTDDSSALLQQTLIFIPVKGHAHVRVMPLLSDLNPPFRPRFRADTSAARR